MCMGRMITSWSTPLKVVTVVMAQHRRTAAA